MQALALGAPRSLTLPRTAGWPEAYGTQALASQKELMVKEGHTPHEGGVRVRGVLTVRVRGVLGLILSVVFHN